MLHAMITWSLSHRLIVLLGALVVTAPAGQWRHDIRRLTGATGWSFPRFGVCTGSTGARFRLRFGTVGGSWASQGGV